MSRSNGTELTIGSWTFRRSLTGGGMIAIFVYVTELEAQDLETYDTFSFIKCIRPFSGRMEYFVRVTADTVSQNAIIGTNTASRTVSMGQLSVIVQEL